MTASNPQSYKEQKYWDFFKNRPYYLYIADTYTGKPIEVMVMWASSPKKLLERAPPNANRDYNLGWNTFTLLQSHKILQGIKRNIYGQKLTPHQWDLPTTIPSYMWDMGIAYDHAYGPAVINWKRQEDKRR